MSVIKKSSYTWKFFSISSWVDLTRGRVNEWTGEWMHGWTAETVKDLKQEEYFQTWSVNWLATARWLAEPVINIYPHHTPLDRTKNSQPPLMEIPVPSLGWLAVKQIASIE